MSRKSVQEEGPVMLKSYHRRHREVAWYEVSEAGRGQIMPVEWGTATRGMGSPSKSMQGRDII